jgi:hypothetical protein
MVFSKNMLLSKTEDTNHDGCPVIGESMHPCSLHQNLEKIYEKPGEYTTTKKYYPNSL